MKITANAKDILNVIKPILAYDNRKPPKGKSYYNEDKYGHDVRIKFDKNLIEMRSVDPARVSMMRIVTNIKASVKDGYVKKYKLDKKEEEHVFNITKLANILTAIGNKDVTLETKGRNLIIETDDLTQMTPMSIEDPNYPKVPVITVPATWDVSVASLKKKINYMMRIADYVRMKYDKGLVSYETKDRFKNEDEGRNCMVFVDAVEHKPFDGDDKPYTSLFQSDYLKSIIQYVTSPTVTLHIGNDLPLRVTYSLKNTDFEILLAPRIEHD